MKFDGTSWVLVGPANFTPMTFCANIAFGSNGDMFLAYQDIGNLQKITLLKFNGTNWVAYGPAGPRVTNYLYVIKITIGPDGFPYISFSDTDNNGQVTVMKCDGTSWLTIGSAGFSTGSMYNTDITFDSNGNLYVAEDGDGYANVWTFTNSTWTHVGSTGFSGSGVIYLSFAINPFDKLYTSFVLSSTCKLSLMNYGYPTGINDIANNEMQIYPNPAKNWVSLQINSNYPGTKTIQLFNSTGCLLNEIKTTENKVAFPLNDYSSGMYFIKVTSDNVVWSGKFCKMQN
jgi:hypothetical protein